MSLSSPSTRRKLLLDSDEAPEDDQPNAWTCSYVMSSGDGVNLLGTLDVDRNRARFVANSGLFGTAYQFVMPRDQIQIVRVPTASSPYNALELHTKYRQNILCDFDDNVATFKRCCEVMKLDVLPQDEPLIAVLPTDVSDHANKWRARAAQKRREREAAEALAARGGGEPDDGHQLTQQVMHLHGEKVALQRRMFELERENEHLHGEVEVLYAQVDEQSERSQRQREALEAAAREALDDVLAADMEKERTRREAAREKEKLLRASQREEGEKENKAVTPPDSALKKAEQEARAEVSEAEKLKNVQRQDELVASVASLREERAMFEGEVARLRLELERRDAEREEKLANADANDANAENAENKASSSLDAEERDDDMQDMLAMEVQRLLAKQAELSNHLARAQREKEMLEKENELLYQQTEAVEEDAQTARFERALAWERLSEAESAAGFRVLETAIAPSSPPRDNDVVSPSVSSRASPIKAGGPPIGSGSALPKMEKAKKKASDGPDAELAAKLIGRLERGGESDEAASLKLEMERMKAELGRMKAERAESLGRSRVGSDAASETKPSEEDERRRSGEDTGDSASAAAAAALRAALEKKEEELRIERRRVAKEIAAATKRAAAEASAREKEEALWRVTEAELRAADAERALEALRVEKEESERALALATEELRSERSRSRAGSVSASLSLSQAGENDGSRVSLPFGVPLPVPLPDPPGFGTDDRTSSDGGWSVPERVWQEILLEKESALSALSASDKAKEDEIERLRERLSKLERRAKKEASTHEGSTPSPPKRSVSRSVKSSPATAFNETRVLGVGKLPAIDVSGKSVTRLDSPTAKATERTEAKSPRSPFAKGLTGLGVAAAGFVFGKLSPQ
jgi:hypothetical protein